MQKTNTNFLLIQLLPENHAVNHPLWCHSLCVHSMHHRCVASNFGNWSHGFPNVVLRTPPVPVSIVAAWPAWRIIILSFGNYFVWIERVCVCGWKQIGKDEGEKT